MNNNNDFMFKKELRDETLNEYSEEIQQMVADGSFELAMSHMKNLVRLKNDFAMFN